MMVSSAPEADRYTSRLIKATALLPDTRLLLAGWDLSQDTADNLAHARQSNVFGKAARTRVANILIILRQRYFSDPDVGRALATLVQRGAPSRWVDPLLYYYAVQNDATLRAIILDVIATRRKAGHASVQVEHVSRVIRGWVTEQKTASTWNEITIGSVARHAMAALRDFGVLSGTKVKSISPVYLPIEAFAFLALDLQRRLTSGERVLHSPEWGLFFLDVDGVERMFVDAHQEHLLAYHAAGPVVRLDFPTGTLETYAHVLTERIRSTEGTLSEA